MADQIRYAHGEIKAANGIDYVMDDEIIKHNGVKLKDVVNVAQTALNSKTDKSYVDSELAKKADAAALNSKADASVVAQLQANVNTKADASTVSALSERVSTNETNIATANSRIDEIVAIPPGSTEGNTELIDIRTGADGKKYPTAGDAVRSQVTDLKSDLNNITEVTYNLVESSISSSGVDAGGNIFAQNITDLHIARVESGKTYTISTNENSVILGWYSNYPVIGSKTYNGARVSSTNKTVTAPITGYIAFRSLANYANPQIVEGTATKPYVPHRTANDIDARAEISSVSDEFSTFKTATNTKIENNINGYILNLSEHVYDNTYINETGEFTWSNTSTNRTTELIPVSQSKIYVKIKESWGLNVGWDIAFYDADKDFISGVRFGYKASIEQNVNVPVNAKFFAVCNNYFDSADYVVLDNKPFVAIDLVPYFDQQRYIDMTGTAVWNTNWRCTQFIRVDQLRVSPKLAFHWGGTTAKNIAFYNKNKQFIGGYSESVTTHSGWWSVPDGSYYVRFCTTADTLSSASVIIYSPVKDYSKITVDTTGNGDFEKIQDAVDWALDGTEIYVKNGVYDEHVKAWGKEISIIGENPYSTIIRCGECNYENPPMEFGAGILRNLKIERTNTGDDFGYVVHVEDDHQFKRNILIDNCILETPAGKAPLGMGMRGNSSIKFVNTKFVMDNTKACLYIHDASDPVFTGEFNLLFDNCLFKYEGGNDFAQFDSREIDGALVNFGFNNCRFDGGSSTAVTIYCRNAKTGGQSTNPEDYNGLINWRLMKDMSGNNVAKFNTLRTYE